MKKIYLGADHAGYKLKEKIKQFFIKQKIQFDDLGNLLYDKNDDYPDFALPVAQKVGETNALGILICGSSFGMVITANKFKNLRAVAVNDPRNAKLSRQHNNANILCLSGGDLLENKIKTLQFEKIKKIILSFINTNYRSVTRHQRRLNKIKKIEKQNLK